ERRRREDVGRRRDRAQAGRRQREAALVGAGRRAGGSGPRGRARRARGGTASGDPAPDDLRRVDAVLLPADDLRRHVPAVLRVVRSVLLVPALVVLLLVVLLSAHVLLVVLLPPLLLVVLLALAQLRLVVGPAHLVPHRGRRERAASLGFFRNLKRAAAGRSQPFFFWICSVGSVGSVANYSSRAMSAA